MQLALPVSFSKHDDFSTFVAGENQQVVQHLQNLVLLPFDRNQMARRISVVSGLSGYGKSHLLLAVCELASQHKIGHQYLNLQVLRQMPVQILDTMGQFEVLCIDNLDAICDSNDWQIAIFDLINQFNENGGRCLVFASNQKVDALPFTLPDLVTRLKWGTNYSLLALSDEEKRVALQNHAHAIGLALQEDALRFLLSRISRDMHKLVAVLLELDKLSLQDKRKITIPFIKSALSI